MTNRDGNWEVYSIGADGTHPRNLTHNPQRTGSDLLPDGTDDPLHVLSRHAQSPRSGALSGERRRHRAFAD
jgi:hypothetical protein